MSHPLSETPHCGDIFYVADSRNPDSPVGKPALILSSDDFNASHSSVLVAWIAGNDKEQSPFHVPFVVKPNCSGFILCDQISAVFMDRLKDYAGTISFEGIKQVHNNLSILFNLPPTDADECASAPCNNKPFDDRDIEELQRRLEETIAIKNALLDDVIALKAAHASDLLDETVHSIEMQTLRLERNNWRVQATLYRRQYEALLAACRNRNTVETTDAPGNSG